MGRKKIWTSDPGDRKDVVVGVWRMSARAWKALRAAVPDPETLGESHAEWAAGQRLEKDESEAKGYVVVVHDLDPAALEAWCRENRRGLDAEGRTRYGLSLLTDRLGGPRRASRGRKRSC